MSFELIGISGKAGTGKDFVAREILRPLGYQNVGFAWALKMDGMSLKGFSFDAVFREKPPEVRRWLQAHGVAIREIEDRDHWIKRLDTLIQVLHREGGIDKFVVTDVRFPNEAEYVRRAGGKLVRLRHGDRPYPLAGTPAAEHASETALDECADWDVTITTFVGISRQDILRTLAQGGIVHGSRTVKAPDPEQLDLLSTVGRCC